MTTTPTIGSWPSGSLPGPGGSAPGGAGCPPNCQLDVVGAAIHASAGSVVYFEEQRRNLSDLQTIVSQRRRVQAALKILAASWLVPFPHAASAIQRDVVINHAKAELLTLLRQTLTTSITLMVEDVRRLTPFPWNPFASAERAEIQRLEREVVETGRLAEIELKSPSTFREIRSQHRGALEYRPGTGIQELQQINQTKLWRNQ